MQCGLIALVQVLGLATWFSASAVVPTLEADWGISHAAAVWLTAATQLGFVAGAVTSAVLNLADRMPAHVLIALSTVGAMVVADILESYMAQVTVRNPANPHPGQAPGAAARRLP